MSARHTFRPAQLVLGFDGGGSKTLAWLVPADPKTPPTPIGHGQAGPSNPRVVGIDVAGDNILQAAKAAFENAGYCRQPVAAAGVALAGVGNETMRRAMETWCGGHRLATAVRVVHDALAVLYSGSRHGTGIALIAGTGSFAFGRVGSGTTARAGGWGYVFGDEGSGFWLGVAALRAITHADDGRAPQTAMTAMMLEQLGIDTVQDLVPKLCLECPPRRLLASLAPIAIQCADRSDPVAQGLVRAAADHLARQVAAVARRLNMPARHYRLCLAGGLLAGSRSLVRHVEGTLIQRGCKPRKVQVIAHPVAGAARIARHLHADPHWTPYSSS